MTTAGNPGSAPPGEDALETVRKQDSEGAIHLFNRLPVAFTRGRGSRLWDLNGKEYLDFLMGIAVCGLGHCNPKVVRAIQEQVAELGHTSNLFYIPRQAELVAKLHQLSDGYLSYISNSGSEANECAIKLARKFGKVRHDGRYEIITAINSFHGRTMACISATGQEKVKKGFEPLLPGFVHVAYNDLPALEAAITSKTTAIMLEVIQAESTNTVSRRDYLQAVRRLCSERGLLLIFDEVQTGIARSGEMFAWQLYDVRPDIFTLAKALGNGIPISACLALPEVASAFEPGDHGGTYGGNPLACAAALAVLKTIEEEGILEQVRGSGQLFMERLNAMARRVPLIQEVRGLGLVLALVLSEPAARKVVNRALERGLVINATSDSIIRLRPALNITAAEIDEGLSILENCLTRLDG